MTFKELPEEAKEAARNALAKMLGDLAPGADWLDAENAGEKVAGAFIKLEHYDSAPDICKD
ncbi:hypothetical protein M8S83_23150 [Enterobacter asburiae]|uniref:hypothetical protein n=1 Tax=Enterobacter asburiae TaxID=61645 RepID=UPI002076284A|nr:hypothetical protein [Enterobacter asburiae]MCM7774997.1 hypothetical protein [Enterobacter asburiae]